MKKCLAVVVIMLMIGMAAGDVFAQRSGGTFYIAAPYGGDFFSLDPHKSSRTQDYLVELNMNRSLYQWDPDQNKPVPALAKSVDIAEDGMTYTYMLRDDVKFHNGRTMTADDIIWSYERIMNAATASSCSRYVRAIQGAKEYEDGEADAISGLRKIDDFTLEITMAGVVDPAYPLFRPCAAILPQEEVEKDEAAFGLAPVGCGPFQFVKWVKGSELILAKFPDYFEEGKPYLDKLVYSVMPEAAARDIAFRAEELDATIVDSSQYEAYLQDEVFSKNLVEVAEMYTRNMGFSPDFEPFSDKRVRQAMNYAIDSDLIIRKFLKNKAYPAVGFLPTTSSAFDPQAQGYTYDPEQAKALMQEAGYEEGFEFSCIATSNKSWGAEVVETLIPFLKEINVTVDIQLMEGAALSQKVFHEQDWDAYMWSLDSGPNPLQALRRWHSDNPQSGGNFVRYNNPDYDALLDAAAQERDEGKKIALLRQADGMFREDAALWFFNYNKAIIVKQPWVHGIKPVAVEHMYQDFTNIWIEESSPRANEK
ncbi:ABC transporter substrate-binding protein [candidate division KSB3 bacterium]|uniref:ABC transporter substrate-binding protein n=1 Tax=candidate division KSB3 bacterium TaxID=2044937 RepID=A0A9D5Q529_9BACT|nr:ABC transporter substrate-binding protein [candidate division KSB3 bacterium]MBD3323893.1 ABC transporter substrate-binding protein [candidate division KSB3 bacterium]